MSEAQQEYRSNAGVKRNENVESQHAAELVLAGDGTQPIYANFCRVTATPEELFLDFGVNPEPFAAGRRDVKANPRVIMNFFTARRIVAALMVTIQRHETAFGLIELDVRRRAGLPETELSHADKSTSASSQSSSGGTGVSPPPPPSSNRTSGFPSSGLPGPAHSEACTGFPVWPRR